MKNPDTIISDLVRKMNNTKNGNHTIKDWLELMGNKKVINNEVPKKIELDEILKYDEDENLLNNFEEDIIEDLDETNFDIINVVE